MDSARYLACVITVVPPVRRQVSSHRRLPRSGLQVSVAVPHRALGLIQACCTMCPLFCCGSQVREEHSRGVFFLMAGAQAAGPAPAHTCVLGILFRWPEHKAKPDWGAGDWYTPRE